LIVLFIYLYIYILLVISHGIAELMHAYYLILLTSILLCHIGYDF